MAFFFRAFCLGGLAAGLLLGQPGAAAPRPPARAVAPLPAAAGPARPVPAAATRQLAALRQERAFRYVEATPPAPSAWDTFWAQFWRWVGRWLRSTSYQGFWRWVVYGLLVGAAVFVVLKLLQVDLTAAFGRSPRRPGQLAYDTAPENIHELDFAARLREAEATGNLRLATRLGYLQLLKQLTDQHLIDWQPDKTNQAYLRELAAARPAQAATFTELTRQFEYVWYGEFPLAAPTYRQLRGSQQQLGQALAGAARG